MLSYTEHIKPYLDLNGALPTAAATLPDGNALLHPFYAKIKAQKEMIDGLFGDKQPSWMALNRPKESEAHKKYRNEIFKNDVKSFLGRVRNQFAQIKNVEDYSVVWPIEDTTKHLKVETENKRFSGDTLEGWFWAKWTHYALTDPNGAAVLLPTPTQNDREKPQFIAQWVSSGKIWQHRKGEFAVIESEEKNPIFDVYKNTQAEGKILYFFDKESYCVARQIKVNSGQNTSVWEVSGLSEVLLDNGEAALTFAPTPHYCAGLPFVLAGYHVKEVYEGGRYEFLGSVLEDAIPHLQKALQRAEDKEIVVLHHSVPREWEYAPKPCPTCKGRKSITTYEGEEEITRICPTCKGGGVADTRNGLGVYQLTAPVAEAFDDQMRVVSLPTPPMGRIDGDTTAVKVFREEFDAEIALAYRALGMEYLHQVPLAQSGIAKRHDAKEGEMNLVVAGGATGEKLTWLYHCTASILYGIVGDMTKLLPTIKTPKRFDVEGVEIVGERLKEAVLNGYSSEIIYSLTLKYLEVTTGKSSDEYKMYQLRKRIDPYWALGFEALNYEQSQAFQTMNRDSKAFQRKNELIELSKNFEMLVQECLIEVPNFWALDIKTQREKLMEKNKPYFDVRTDNYEILPKVSEPLVNTQNNNQLKRQ